MSAARKRGPPSATTPSTSSAGSTRPATSRSRSPSIATGGVSTSASVTAASSGVTRRSSRKARRRRCRSRPAAGLVERYLAPGGPGVRMDSHLFAGYEVPPFYDSLLGKLIVWGATRQAAIERGQVALAELMIEGIVTNIPIHQALLSSDAFLEGRMTTNLLDRVGSAAFLAAAARA